MFDLLVSSATDPPVAAAQPMPPAEGGGSSSSIDRSGDAGLDNYFYSVAELTRLPGLPGDPVIDLGALSEELIGRLELRLFIDANGRVVKKRIEGDSGWPNSIVDAVARAFAGYPYVPGQRHGVAVNSQVVLLIQVREGQISAGVTQEFGPN